MDPFELTPAEQQRIMAETLRSQQVLGDAQRRGARFDNLAAIAPMLNNKAIAETAAGAQRTAQAQAKPVQLGQTGFMVGDKFAPNPGFLQEKLESRAQQRGLQAQRALEQASLQEERLRQQAEQNALNRDMRRDLAAESNALRRDLATQNMELRRDLAAQTQANKEAAAQAKADAKPKGKALPISAANKLATAAETADSYQEFLGSWDDKFTGPVGLGSPLAKFTNTLGRFAPIETGYENQANWWQNYNAQANRVRNELFGSALTAAESKLFEEANITPGMKPEMVKTRLAQQARAMRQAQRKLASTYGRAGYDVSQFEIEEAPAAPAPGVLDKDGKPGANADDDLINKYLR